MSCADVSLRCLCAGCSAPTLADRDRRAAKMTKWCWSGAGSRCASLVAASAATARNSALSGAFRTMCLASPITASAQSELLLYKQQAVLRLLSAAAYRVQQLHKRYILSHESTLHKLQDLLPDSLACPRKSPSLRPLHRCLDPEDPICERPQYRRSSFPDGAMHGLQQLL